MIARRPPRECRWCPSTLGVIAGWLYICPRCDYNNLGGGPNEDRVKDQQPRP